MVTLRRSAALAAVLAVPVFLVLRPGAPVGEASSPVHEVAVGSASPAVSEATVPATAEPQPAQPRPAPPAPSPTVPELTPDEAAFVEAARNEIRIVDTADEAPPPAPRRARTPLETTPFETPPVDVAAPEPSVPVAPAPVLANAPDLRESTFQAAAKVFSPQPDYPDAARAGGESGTVVLEAVVDTDGSVATTRVLRGAGPALDLQARETLRRWLFSPATEDGVPVEDTYRVAFRFDLETPQVFGPEDGATIPVKLAGPSPRYPQPDWVAGHEGQVTLRAIIDEEGQVAATEVVSGISPGLDRAAMTALEDWTFEPARFDGRPVRAETTVVFRFSR